MLMTFRTASASFIVFSLSVAPVRAAGHPPATKGGNPHTTITKSHAANTTRATTTPPKTTHGNPHSTTTGSPKTTTTSNKGATTSGTTAPSSTGTTELNPIAQKISSKPNLSSKLQAMLPKDMTLNQASLGFKNQGQFIAALHVSKNLKIPFAELKTAMTGIDPTLPPGTTQQQPTTTMSLGQAIQKLRPSADADGAAKTAENQASTDVNSTTTTANTPKKKTSK